MLQAAIYKSQSELTYAAIKTSSAATPNMFICYEHACLHPAHLEESISCSPDSQAIAWCVQVQGPYDVTLVNREYHKGRHIVNVKEVADNIQAMNQVRSTRSVCIQLHRSNAQILLNQIATTALYQLADDNKYIALRSNAPFTHVLLWQTLHSTDSCEPLMCCAELRTWSHYHSNSRSRCMQTHKYC